MLLAGRSAVVTGASRGIGRAIADALEQAGARVAGLARTAPGEGAETGATGRIALRCDVTREADVRRAAEAVLAALGPPDVLVNNAGAFLLRPLADTSDAEFRQQLEVNTVGAFLVARAFLPAMAERGGHVITVGSVADHVGFPGNVAYAASKYGVRGLHEALRAEFGGAGVRFTLLSPGPTDTTIWDPVDPDRRHDLPDRAGMLQPRDVAEAVLFAATRPPRVAVELLRLMPA